MKVLLVTEANERVASGHLFECLEIGRFVVKCGHEVELLINSDIQKELRDRISLKYLEYNPPIDNSVDIMIDAVIESKADCVVTNLRKISNEFVIEYNTRINEHLKSNRNSRNGLNSSRIPLICIDEFGNRLLSCDAIINPMIDSKYWNYPGKMCLEFCGQEYLVLADSLIDYNKRVKTINDQIGMVTVSMGGVDVRAHSMELARILPQVLPYSEINIVCGGGFERFEELCNLVKGKKQITVHRNIDYLYELFYKSDLAFCAGGNTLHELAAIGTPTIIIPSMPHELDNARCFVRMGFGVSVDNYRDYSFDDVKMSIELLSNPKKRSAISENGKRIVDGRGKERIVRILESML